MSKITLNSVSPAVFRVNASEGANSRADIIAKGRMLTYEHALRGKEAMLRANKDATSVQHVISEQNYKVLNEKFQQEHMLYAAKVACSATGETAPETWDDFKRQGQRFYGNSAFYRVLQGIYQEIITPILPAVYSEAISMFADMVEVGFGETYAVSVGSNDIPVFQDSSWGASRSVPVNTFYSRDYTLNPMPKTAEIGMKWHQMVGNGQDFGAFFANIAAGMYAKTAGMWNEALTAAKSNTSLIPASLNLTFNTQNWVSLVNKLAALNSVGRSSIFATGSAIALAKVLPTQATGSTNVDMDAALATLLGGTYNTLGHLGEFMATQLIAMQDVIIPGTQNTTATTMLSANDIWLMSSRGRKPMTIAYNSATPISIEFDPTKTADFTIGMNLTIALDSVAVFASKVGHITI